MYRYELYICHSDHTWSDGHFVDVDESDMLGPFLGSQSEVAIEKYKKENPNADIVFIGRARFVAFDSLGKKL